MQLGGVQAAQPALTPVLQGLVQRSSVVCRAAGMSRASSNPQKLGTPRRVASLSSQLDAFCRDLGGDRPIYRCCPHMV